MKQVGSGMNSQRLDEELILPFMVMIFFLISIKKYLTQA